MKAKGEGLVEYALILVLIAIVVVGIFNILSNRVQLRECEPGYVRVQNACVLGYDIREGNHHGDQ